MNNQQPKKLSEIIIDIVGLTFGLIPFSFGLIYGIYSANTFLETCLSITVGFLGTLTVLGFVGEIRGKRGSGILSVIAGPIFLWGLIFLIANWFFK